MTILFGLAVLLLALLGTPLFVIISAIAMVSFYGIDIDSSVVMVEMYRMATAPTLIAIPLFTFAGYVLAESNAPKRLTNLANAFLGWMPGGLAVVALVSSAFFTAFTGASGVTIIALGGLLYPILLKEKYPERFSLGLLTSSGSIGLLFPPSLPIILYGLVAKVSIDKLFIAGILPGIMLVTFVSFYSIRKGLYELVPRTEFRINKAYRALRDSIWEIPLPFLILGGIYGGIFTVTEAAAITAFYVI
ncbi:MAG: TRAP transporter large permease subunit, partial [Nitrospinota bacterium]